jgi:Holliday junction resolvase
MVNQKDKGRRWERDATKKLNERIKDSNFKRIPGSGAMGTILKEPLLASDIQGKVPYFNNKFILEAKVGYGGTKYMTMRKEWFDKVAEEAETAMGTPGLVCKFDNVRVGTSTFVAFDLDVFSDMMNEVNDLYIELNELYEKLSEMEE